MGESINEAVSDLLKGFGANLEPGRKRELKVELTVSMNEFANRIDEGYNFEVRAEPPTAGDEKEDAETKKNSAHFATIAKEQKHLQFIHREGKPVLRLPTNPEEIKMTLDAVAEKDTADEEPATPKPRRKRRPTKRAKGKSSA